MQHVVSICGQGDRQ